MGRQQLIFKKEFNPYDLNDVALINDSERQRPLPKKTRKENSDNHSREKEHRGLLKLQDEEKK